MPDSFPNPLRPGQSHKAADANRQARAVEALTRTVGGGGIGVTDAGGGPIITDTKPVGFWALLTGGLGNAYSWVEQIELAQDTWAAGQRSGTVTATTSVLPAYEVNGVTGLVGTRVWVWPSAAGDSYLFSYCCGGSPSPATVSFALICPSGTSGGGSRSGNPEPKGCCTLYYAVLTTFDGQTFWEFFDACTGDGVAPNVITGCCAGQAVQPFVTCATPNADIGCCVVNISGGSSPTAPCEANAVEASSYCVDVVNGTRSYAGVGGGGTATASLDSCGYSFSWASPDGTFSISGCLVWCCINGQTSLWFYGTVTGTDSDPSNPALYPCGCVTKFVGCLDPGESITAGPTLSGTTFTGETLHIVGLCGTVDLVITEGACAPLSGGSGSGGPPGQCSLAPCYNGNVPNLLTLTLTSFCAGLNGRTLEFLCDPIAGVWRYIPGSAAGSCLDPIGQSNGTISCQSPPGTIRVLFQAVGPGGSLAILAGNFTPSGPPFSATGTINVEAPEGVLSFCGCTLPITVTGTLM